MKLLFDQNLSHRLVQLLEDVFPDSQHVRNVGLKAADDPIVWDYAKEHKFVIVSKDADFHQRSLVLGYPPKVIWVRLGNCSTADVEQLLRHHEVTIDTLEDDSDISFLESLRGKRRVYFAGAKYARGVIEGLKQYKFVN